MVYAYEPYLYFLFKATVDEVIVQFYWNTKKEANCKLQVQLTWGGKKNKINQTAELNQIKPKNWIITNNSETKLKQLSLVQNSSVRFKTIRFGF